MQQYVCYLEIPMHGIDLVKTSEAIKNLLEESSGLVLCQSLLAFQILLQITSVAILHTDELSTLGTKRVNKADDIFIMALPQNSDFSLDEFSQLGSFLHKGLRDGLDRDSCVGCLIEGFVNDGPGSLS